MRHIRTSIGSMHLATGGNNKILRTPPPHISSSEEILHALLVAPLLNSDQINHLSSNHIYTMSTPKHSHHHYTPFVTHTHIISSTAPIYALHYHPWIRGQTLPELLHCWPYGQRSWLVDHKREDRTPPHYQGSWEWVDNNTMMANKNC